MTSLRSRLILGSSLVAVVPMALAMYLLSQRIESMVRDQAAERLSAALGGLQAELQATAAETAEKLSILAKDPALRRLYLVQAPDGELEAYLEERRFLLGLDFLRVESSGGADTSSGLALAASTPIRYQNAIAGWLRGGLILDREYVGALKRTRGVDLMLRDPGGRAVAATLPSSAAPTVEPGRDVTRIELGGQPYLSRSFALDLGGGRSGIVTGLVSASAADRTISALQVASLVLALSGVGLAVGLGVMWSSQVSRPVERLAALSRRLSQGEWDEPVTLQSVGELQTLVTALERMRNDLRRYREQLVIGERHAAWSQMARQVAHEVKNPLTPIAVSVADLKRSFDQKRPDFPQILDQAVRTIGDEVQALKKLLNEFSDFARLPAPELAPCDLSVLWADLETLYAQEVAQGRLSFSSRPQVEFSADAAQIRQALVNLIKNGLEAVDGAGRVTVSAAVAPERLEIAVSDTGPGLDPEQKANLFVPGFTTKSTGSGLGLTIVERIVNDHGGTIGVESGPTGGTAFRIHLPLEPRS
jgi:two-component system nitrogen regulation sensor histidine kinase NtrY